MTPEEKRFTFTSSQFSKDISESLELKFEVLVFFCSFFIPFFSLLFVLFLFMSVGFVLFGVVVFIFVIELSSQTRHGLLDLYSVAS